MMCLPCAQRSGWGEPYLFGGGLQALPTPVLHNILNQFYKSMSIEPTARGGERDTHDSAYAMAVVL